MKIVIDLTIGILVTTLLFMANASTHASEIKTPTTLEVTVKSLDVRDAPPWPSWKTVFTFRYSINPPIATLKNGFRITGQEVRYIGRDQRWIKISYSDNGSVKHGWIFTGQKPNIVNVKVVEEPSSRTTAIKNEYISLDKKLPFSLLFSSARADEITTSSGEEAKEPDMKAKSIEGVLFQVIYAILFIASFVLFYKLTKDKYLTIFGSASILLIFGFISEAAFTSIANMLSG